jgi:hypothetical protein
MARTCQENGHLLVETIQSLGGVPGLRQVTMAPADLHFQGLSVALPRVLADWRALIHKYEMAQRQVHDPVALAVLTKILERHRAAETSLFELNAPATKTG